MRRLCFMFFSLWMLSAVADRFVDDIYYTPEDALRRKLEQAEKSGTMEPNFNKNAKEIVFLTDTAAVEHPDTVRILIRNLKP